MAMQHHLLVFISAFASGDDGAIHAYHFDLDNGQLELVQRTTDIEHPFFMALSPDNKFLYAIHAPGQFGGKANEEVAAYAIAGSKGRLTLLGIQSSLGKGPQNLAITPGGEFLFCANMPGNSVALFRIDPETGGLTQVGEPVSIPSPSCIMIAE